MRAFALFCALLVCGGCSEDAFGPAKEPGFIGDWISQISWVDTTVAMGWQDGHPIKARLPFVVYRTQIFRFHKGGRYSSYLSVQYEYPPEKGWVGTFTRATDSYWIIYRGTWYNKGNFLRFVVESTERFGRWDFWSGSEYTVVWKKDGQKLILRWRDNTGFYTKKSFGVIFEPIEDFDKVPILPTLKNAKP
jgi:hypothetical protein